MLHTLKSLPFCLASLVTVLTVTDAAALEPVRLRCEYLENPVGIDIDQSRLSWQVKSSARGDQQSAYRVLVASSAEGLAAGKADLWDSGKVESDQTLFVRYAGKPLESRQQCFWNVHVWNRADAAPTSSDPASWSIALLDDSDWTAQYISFRDETPIHTDVSTFTGKRRP